MSDITTEYRGITISYDERGNKWVFEKGGRERSIGTLTAAKEAIDKPEPKEKNFKRTQVWLKDYQGTRLVDVTAIADTKLHSGGMEFWIMENKTRCKKSGSEIYAVTPENNALFTEIAKLTEAKQALNDKISEAGRKLKNFKPE